MKPFLILISTCITVSSFSQDTLTEDNAVKIALENHYNILIYKNQAKIATNNNTMLNTSAMPTLIINSGQSIGVSSSKIVRISGPNQENPAARSTALTGSALLNWNLFNGFNAVISKKGLEELENLGELQFRVMVENSIEEVKRTYYTVVQQQRLLDVAFESFNLSKLRYKLAEDQYRVGKFSKLSLSQAKVDKSQDSATVIRLNIALKVAKSNLNRLLARNPGIDFTIAREVSIQPNLDFDQLLSELNANNAQILAASSQVEVDNYTIKLAKTGYYPSLSAYGGINYSRTTNQVGFSRSSRSYGPTGGIRLNYNIFNNVAVHRQVQNSKLMMNSDEVRKNQMTTLVTQTLYSDFAQYSGNLEIMNLEKENITVAKQNLDTSLEMFLVGALSDNEFRQTQQKVIDAQSRFYVAEYNAKLAEISILKLSGNLLQ